MKKILLFLCILAISDHVLAFTTQGHWRWRNDNGSETSATYLADTNTAPTITSSSNIRLRTEIYNSNTDPNDISNTTLAYSLTGADGSWILISDTTANKDFALSKSIYVKDSEATTQQLPARAGYTFQPGRIIQSSSTYAYMLPPAYSTEFEWVIKPTTSAMLNTTYYFKTSVLGYDMPLPTLTIGATLAVILTDFSVEAQNNRAVIKWNTASEVNSDHFDILRSSDGQTWQKIATVKAKGNTTGQSNYEVTDNNPLNGNSFYKLQQYDKRRKIKFLPGKNLYTSVK